jgi:hypothetical protein
MTGGQSALTQEPSANAPNIAPMRRRISSRFRMLPNATVPDADKIGKHHRER